MAGAGGPKVAENLVRAHAEGFLGAALRDPDSSHRMMVAAVTGGDLDALVWARTAALVATLDGQVIGGNAHRAGHTVHRRPAEKHHLDTTAVMRALLFTSKLHLVPVDEGHRERGLGRALVSAATGLVSQFHLQLDIGDRGLTRLNP